MIYIYIQIYVSRTLRLKVYISMLIETHLAVSEDFWKHGNDELLKCEIFLNLLEAFSNQVVPPRPREASFYCRAIGLSTTTYYLFHLCCSGSNFVFILLRHRKLPLGLVFLSLVFS